MQIPTEWHKHPLSWFEGAYWDHEGHRYNACAERGQWYLERVTGGYRVLARGKSASIEEGKAALGRAWARFLTDPLAEWVDATGFVARVIECASGEVREIGPNLSPGEAIALCFPGAEVTEIGRSQQTRDMVWYRVQVGRGWGEYCVQTRAG